jgi:hypothetical protein
MSIKVSLETEAADSIKQMIEQLKAESPGISISPSDLTSWILVRFRKSYFDKAAPMIANAHFNPKAYLREKLKTAQSKEELSAIMSEIQKRIRQPSIKRKRLKSP